MEQLQSYLRSLGKTQLLKLHRKLSRQIRRTFNTEWSTLLDRVDLMITDLLLGIER